MTPSDRHASGPKGRILIVDDELVVRDSLQKWFEGEGYDAGAVVSGVDALAAVQQQRWDLALVDIKMPGMDGMELQNRLREADPDLIVIVMTGYASVETAVRALKSGAYDYITKPIDPDELVRLVSSALMQSRCARELERLRESLSQTRPDSTLIGNSPPMRRVLDQIEVAASTDTTVLIAGESGTGKELAARAIHAASSRRHMPMVVIHCGALNETLLEEELFGREQRGTAGTQSRKKGKFELADGGAVLLDEIGEASQAAQAALLRVLHTKEVRRVGGAHSITLDFRCIAATSRNPEDLLRGGAVDSARPFLSGAYVIHLPPLRERREDAPLLASHFLTKFAGAMNKPVPRLSPQALELVLGYDWPGNVRELENAMERAMVIGREPEIQPADFPFQLQASPPASAQSLDEVERLHIERVLREVQRNISRAARILEIDRTTLYNKLRRYGLK